MKKASLRDLAELACTLSKRLAAVQERSPGKVSRVAKKLQRQLRVAHQKWASKLRQELAEPVTLAEALRLLRAWETTNGRYGGRLGIVARELRDLGFIEELPEYPFTTSVTAKGTAWLACMEGM